MEKHWYWVGELRNGEWASSTFGNCASIEGVWQKMEQVLARWIDRGRVDTNSIVRSESGISFIETRHHSLVEWRICMD